MHRAAAPKYAPIEYRHIHRGTIPVFTLELAPGMPIERIPASGEGCLLFGTMRAYLGNALVTPKAAWLGEASPLFFPVKSEFVHIAPKDGLTYFWWAFLQSPRFLQSLPIGSWRDAPAIGSRASASHTCGSAAQISPRKNPSVLVWLCGTRLAGLCGSRGASQFDDKVIHGGHHTS